MPAEQTTSFTTERSTFRLLQDPYQSYQEKRRRDALQRQKAARLLSSSRARNLAFEQDGDTEDVDIIQQEAAGAAAAVDDADMDASTSYDVEQSGRPGARGHGTKGLSGSARRRLRQQSSGAGGVRAYGQRYGNELMQPEWMTDVPSDLGSNWLVMPRPEGMRCLLVTSRGRTVSWLRNGAPLHRFHSPLPGGSPATAAERGGSAAAAAAAGDYCILDCIFHQANNTYYIQDLLCWRGYALYDCAAEFRVFWLASKLAEEGLAPPPDTTGRVAVPGTAAVTGSAHSEAMPYRIVPLSVNPCTLQGLRQAYGSGSPLQSDSTSPTDPWASVAVATGGLTTTSPSTGPVVAADVDFLRDGLYFLHRHGHYCPGPAPTPLALLWKDLGCSRYLADTDSEGRPLEHQLAVLVLRADRTVATEDERPVVLGRLPEAFVASMGEKLKPGRLLRFSIRQGGIIFHDGRPAGADLHYEGLANQRRGRADTFSKILFQRLARTSPITLAALTAAVAVAQTELEKEGVVAGDGGVGDGSAVDVNMC